MKDRQSVGTLVSMLEVMMPEAEIFYHHNCPHGHLRKMNTALHTLHSSTLALHHSDIFTPIISSQEGTLDNVKVGCWGWGGWGLGFLFIDGGLCGKWVIGWVWI